MYRPWELIWVDSNGMDGKPTFRRHANLSWLSKICIHFGEIVAWSQKSLTTFKQNLMFSEKRPLTGKFSKMFSERIHADIDPRLVCKFREIWPTGSPWNRALLTRQKNFGSLSRSRFCADRAQNLSGPAPDNIYLECPKFHPKPFTSGGVTADRVNVVQTRHKVFPILGEASASSPSK